MRTGRGVAVVGVVTVAWLAGIGGAFADPSSGPSSPAASSASSTSPAAPVPTATASPRVAPPNTVTATFNEFCTGFGWNVTNTTAAAVTVHVEVNGVQHGDPVVVPAGATVHVPLDPNTEAASTVALVDGSGRTIDSFVVRFCVTVDNISATIAAGTTYTRTGFISISLIPPSPRHGVVVRGETRRSGDFVRYTPDPCFAGADRFGYDDFIAATQGIITVTVLPGACRIAVHRSATDCARNTVSYTATNPYSLPAHLIESNSATPGMSIDLILPAHHTMVISSVRLTQPTAHARVSFTVRDTTHTVLTDEIAFPCPPSSKLTEPGLAASGAAPTRFVALGAAAIAIGAILMWIVRPRRATTARKPNPPHS